MTNPHEKTMRAVRAFVLSRPADQTYEYWDIHECPIGAFIESDTSDDPDPALEIFHITHWPLTLHLNAEEDDSHVVGVDGTTVYDNVFSGDQSDPDWGTEEFSAANWTYGALAARMANHPTWAPL